MLLEIVLLLRGSVIGAEGRSSSRLEVLLYLKGNNWIYLSLEKVAGVLGPKLLFVRGLMKYVPAAGYPSCLKLACKILATTILLLLFFSVLFLGPAFLFIEMILLKSGIQVNIS